MANIETTTTEKPAPIMGVCAKCNAPFQQAKPWQLFCSTKCRVSVHQTAKRADDRKTRVALPKLGRELDAVEALLVTFLAGNDPKFQQVEDALARVRKLGKRVKAMS